jgi:hypothetical protein
VAIEEPRDLLIECGGCGIENLFSDYTAETITVCNQCRTRLIESDFNETHVEYRCEDCQFSICLLQATEFAEGDTPCRCGSLEVHRKRPSTLFEDARDAGALKFEEEELEQEEFDWCRSEPKGAERHEDYNDMFDQDPGIN